MRSKVLLVAACAALVATSALALEFREEPYRVGIIDVGDPILLEYEELSNEMNLNNELRDWIYAYGRPEYAEYQKVAAAEPYLPYEVRLYYIEGRRYVAFGRIAVIPSYRDFGVRKFIGKLDSLMLQRLLTARPLDEAARLASTPPQRDYGSMRTAPPPAQPVVAPAPETEEVVVEEVVEIISPEEAVVVEVEEVTADAGEVEVEVQVVEEEIVIEAVDEGEQP